MKPVYILTASVLVLALLLSALPEVTCKGTLEEARVDVEEAGALSRVKRFGGGHRRRSRTNTRRRGRKRRDLSLYEILNMEDLHFGDEGYSFKLQRHRRSGRTIPDKKRGRSGTRRQD